MRSTLALLAAALAIAATAGRAQQKQYGPGVTDSEIKIGQSTPLSGPASAFGIYSRVEDAYFKSLNEKGGINGRKIKFIILDNGFNPPKALEASRKLVEEDGVLAEVGTVGTPTNSAIQKYLNGKKVPQLLVSAGGSKFNDPKQYPWTVPFYPSFEVEAIGYARYALKAQPNAKIAVLYQNDDYGKDFLKGLKKGLGDAGAKAIVAEASYELTDPTVDSQIISLAGSGANVFMNFTTPKFAAQAIRKIGEIGWKPTTIISNVSASISGVLEPAGKDNSTGVISSQYLKDATDPASKDDAGYKEWLAFMDKYLPDANKSDWLNVYGYTIAQTLVTVLKASGNDLTRANVLKQATTLKDVKLPMLINGTAVNNSPEHYTPMTSLQLIRFDGTRWVPFGDLLKN